MKCSNCGKEIDDDSLFCEYCGTKVSTEQEDSFSDQKKEKTKTKKIPGYFYIIIAGLVGFVLCYFILKPRTSDLTYAYYEEDNNGHEWVDLGLSVNWATCNVGAENPEDYGDYYAWGETETKSDYSWSTLKYCLNSEGSRYSKYVVSSDQGVVDSRIELEAEDDVAHVKWGGSWRMPTPAELNELLFECTWTWTTQNGVNGYLVTSGKAGFTDRSIFLPAAGFRSETSLSHAGSNGFYRTSSLDETGALRLYFFSESMGCSHSSRKNGLSVRPVCPSNNYFKVNKTSLDFDGQGGTDDLIIVCSAEFQITTEASWLSVEKTATGAIITALSNPIATNRTAEIIVQSVGLENEMSTIVGVSQEPGHQSIAANRTAKTTVQSVGLENEQSTIVAASKKPDHQYVDLGLSVYWATCNVGAAASEEYGDYYAWGETETKDKYVWSTYKWSYGSSSTLTKYCTSSSDGRFDNKTVLESADDVAHVKWGGVWRMPTKAELNELLFECTWTWTTQNGVYGYLVTSKKEGFTNRSIFLPAAGYRSDTTLVHVGVQGIYWSSSLHESRPGRAHDLKFVSLNVVDGFDFRFGGVSVRPVCPK